jgi:hypothetical protein
VPLVLGLLAHPAVEAAGVLDRDVAAVVGLVLPAEQLAEEGLGALDVGRRQLVPAQGTGVVDEGRADPRARLSDTIAPVGSRTAATRS